MGGRAQRSRTCLLPSTAVKMNILFCVPDRVTNRLGAPKVYIEISDALKKLGCTCEIVGWEEIAPDVYQFDTKLERNKYYSRQLKRYICERAGEFDVIEYEHEYLPYPRHALPQSTVLVARSVLLAHHARDIQLPMWAGIPHLAQNLFFDLPALLRKRSFEITWGDRISVLKKHLGEALRHRSARNTRWEESSRATATCKSADLVFVTNVHDQRTLKTEGVDPKKTIKLPFGMTRERYKAFEYTNDDKKSPPTIVFVGSYDFRKGGATDIPRIAEYILREYPAAQFRLLGTSGLFVDRQEVLAHFSLDAQERIEVVPEFAPDELPELLRDGSIGIFPSYFEGFPFGVLEMQAAGLPVVAYDAPGPPEMVLDDLLAPMGNWRQLARKVAILLGDREQLQDKQRKARQRAGRFEWREVAERTLTMYKRQMEGTTQPDQNI